MYIPGFYKYLIRPYCAILIICASYPLKELAGVNVPTPCLTTGKYSWWRKATTTTPTKASIWIQVPRYHVPGTCWLHMYVEIVCHPSTDWHNFYVGRSNGIPVEYCWKYYLYMYIKRKRYFVPLYGYDFSIDRPPNPNPNPRLFLGRIWRWLHVIGTICRNT